MTAKLRDLGLTYEEATHGVQSAIAFEIEQGSKATTPKHLRVGVDMSKADMLGLVMLLMSKGLITHEEYIEQMRLAANEELARYEQHIGKQYPGVTVTFR